MGPSIYMDAIVAYRVNGVRYEIPAVYHTSWPTAEEVATVQANDRGGLPDFSFWMPRKRPEPIKTAPPMILPAIRQQGGSWAEDEYPITVLGPRFVKPGDPDVILPEQKFRNQAAVTSGPGDTYVEEFRARRFKLQNDKLSFINYKNLPETQPQFILGCDKDGVYPLCDGDVYYDEDNLSFYVRFDRAHMKDWKDVITSVRDLICSWRKSS